MGVRGLKTFIESNDDLLIKDYHLVSTHLVIDGCNLVPVLQIQSQKDERADLFGGDMVQFGRYIGNFFDNLIKCKITPILVLDGAQPPEMIKSTTDKKFQRSIERFKTVMKINQTGFGNFIMPATASNVFKSVAIDKGIKIVQCMYEADAVVAQLAHQYKCPVLSNDSDFFLIDLPYGVVTIDLLDHHRVEVSRPQAAGQQPYRYIPCALFKQDHFLKFFPNMSQRNLPLLGILVGNDFVPDLKFLHVCSMLPTQMIYERSNMSGRHFRKVTTKQHQKILKVLFFLCGKTREEAVNQVCNFLPKEQRKETKEYIKDNLTVYDVPFEDDFEVELVKLYRSGFEKTFKETFPDKEVLNQEFRDHISLLMNWIRAAMEKSVLSYRFLELAHHNYLFLQANVDDPTLPSAHLCQFRPWAVTLRLLRSHWQEKRPCVVYDREGNSYAKKLLRSTGKLDLFGPLDYLIYHVPNLTSHMRKSILLATFHYETDHFENEVIHYYEWFNPYNAEEFLMMKLILRYIDIETPGVKLWKHFRQTVLLCMMYHYHKDTRDDILAVKLDDNNLRDFMKQLLDVIRRYKYDRMPILSRTRQYNLRLMHQITQLQSALVAFNNLNAFLGDTMSRLRSETWLNSCLIYNIVENLRDKRLAIPELPEIIHKHVD